MKKGMILMSIRGNIKGLFYQRDKNGHTYVESPVPFTFNLLRKSHSSNEVLTGVFTPDEDIIIETFDLKLDPKKDDRIDFLDKSYRVSSIDYDFDNTLGAKRQTSSHIHSLLPKVITLK